MATATAAALVVGWVVDWLSRLVSPELGSLPALVIAVGVAWFVVVRPIEGLDLVYPFYQDGAFAIFATQAGLVGSILWLTRRVRWIGRLFGGR